jgi:hypothetical protein
LTWWDRFATNALARPYPAADYTPASLMLLGLVGLLIFGQLVRSGLRTGAFPRAYTPRGKDPLIRRDKEPRAFRQNLWCGFVLMAVAAFCLVSGLIDAIDPNLFR